MKRLFVLGIILALTSCTMNDTGNPFQYSIPIPERQQMELGTFSISLAVKDIAASRRFYGHLGFSAVGGEIDQNWLILRNGETTIGLFQGMFEENIMTFNPGWAVSGEHPEEFTDIREIQKRLKEKGLTLISEADETTTGPASFTLSDPDGNMIYIDQHR